MSCYNCGRNGMYPVGPKGKQVLLCLDCYTKAAAVHHQQFEAMDHLANQLSSEISWTLGIPDTYPKFQQPQPQPIINTGGVTMNNIHVTDSEIGVLNTGTIQEVDSIVTLFNVTGQEALAKEVSALTQAVIKTRDITDAKKDEIMQLLSTLSVQAATKKGKRKPAVISAVLTALNGMLQGVKAVASLWASTKDLFDQILGN